MIFLDHIIEAIERLGYIKSEYAYTLAIFLEAQQGAHPRSIAREYRKQGEQLTADEKQALGIRASAFYSREALESLTDLGREKIIGAHDATLLYAMLKHYRQRTIREAAEAGIHRFIILAASMECSGCNRLRDTIISSNEAESLFPDDCNREVCALAIVAHAVD